MRDLVYEAADPTTPPARLLEIMKGATLEIQAAVAQNPNAPWEALVPLAGRFPAVVLANPAFHLLPLEDPSRWASLPDWVLRAFIQLPTAPDHLLALAVKRPVHDVYSALVRHPRLTPAQFEEMSGAPSPEMRQLVAQSRRAPLAVLSRLARDPALPVRLAVAANPNAAPDALWLLLQDEAEEVRCALCTHPALTPQMKAELARDDSRRVRDALSLRFERKG